MWLRQTHLIKNLVKKFGNHVQNIQSHEMPGMPKFIIIRPMIKSEKISTEDHKEYWSGVGMLLLLVLDQILPMQPGSYLKPIMVQTLWHLRIAPCD